jgi:hypothetical protein
MRALSVTRVAEPVRNGAGAPMIQANPAPIMPIKTVIIVLIKIKLL